MGLTKLPNASQMGEHITTRDILHYNVKVGVILGKGKGRGVGRTEQCAMEMTECMCMMQRER